MGLSYHYGIKTKEENHDSIKTQERPLGFLKRPLGIHKGHGGDGELPCQLRALFLMQLHMYLTR